MPEVWFIRHGESTSNAGDVAVDRGSTVLTARGQEQARAASLKVPRQPNLVVVTPYVRTRLTAAPLLERFPDTPVEEWDLHEFNILADESYVGKTWMDRRPAMHVYWERNDPDYIDGEGAESFTQFVGRIKTGFAKLQARPEEFVVVFAHGFILQTMRLLLTQPGLSLKEHLHLLPHYTANSPIDNCTIIRTFADAHGVHIQADDLKALDSNWLSEQRD